MSDVDPEKDPALNRNYPSGAPWRGDSGQKAVISAWNGGALASGYGTHGALLTYGGGHSSYYGSEVYAFDLGSRLWKRVTNPYTGPISFPYASTVYPDDSPIPMHTYDYVDYHPGTNSFVLMRGNRDSAAGSNDTSAAIVHMLDLDTGQWRHSQQNGTLKMNSGGISCYDRNRDGFWVLGVSNTTNQMTLFNPNPTNSDGSVGAFTNYKPPPLDIDGAADCDPVDDIFVYTAFRYSSEIYAIDLKNPGSGRVALRQTGDIPARSAAHGWAWSSKRQAFLYWRRGAGVYEFKHIDGSWATGTWRWTNLTASTNAIAPQDMSPDNGVYSRFRVMNWGGEEVGVVVNRADGPVYAFRIPEGSAGTTGVSVALSASPRTIEAGQQTSLTWSSTNAQSCVASGGWTGTRSTSGSALVGPLSATTSFVLDCQSSTGSTGRATVLVTVGTTQAPTTNAAPTISGSPAVTVLAGSGYTFTPTAADSDGDPLTFAIQNKPVWANFNTSTGTLSGVPDLIDVGTVSGVTISVSDGVLATTLPAFSIAVVSAGGYGGTLTWSPPVQDGDGGALVDLAGYNVYIGNEPRNYSRSVRLNNPGVTSYSVDGLIAGDWYFAISSFDTVGNESSKSSEIKVTLGVSGGSTDGGTGGSTDGSTDGGTGGSTGGTTDGGDTATGTSGGISAMGPAELLGMLLAGLACLRRRLGGNLMMMKAGRGCLALAGLGLFGVTGLQADEVDFQARCSAPGVLKCVGFDAAGDAARGSTLFPAGDGAYHASIDNQVRASGGGALKFEILSGSGQNSAGYWLADLGQAFGEGSHFYVQWRQRFSSSMVATNFDGGGFKQIILHRDGSSCANVQVVLQNVNYRGIPQGYSRCGALHMSVKLPDGDHLLQQGDYQCKRRSLNDADCAEYAANQWMTFYLDVKVGTFGSPNSQLNFYVGYEGEPLKKFIELNDFQFEFDNARTDTFRKVQLTPYDTGKNSTLVHETAYTWYDELIVSTQPIAAPNGAPPPTSTADVVAPAPPGAVQFQF